MTKMITTMIMMTLKTMIVTTMSMMMKLMPSPDECVSGKTGEGNQKFIVDDDGDDDYDGYGNDDDDYDESSLMIMAMMMNVTSLSKAGRG